MKLSERRREIHAATEERVQESIDRKGFGSGIFKPDVTIKQWRDKSNEDNHVIDIIPYVVGANPTNAKVRQGDIAYSAEYFVHRKIGPNEDRVLCPAKNFNKPCPICEDRKVLADERGYEDQDVKDLKPSRQVLYNVVVYDTNDEERKGVQVWMVAHWYFEKYIDDLAKASRGRGKVNFASADVGKRIEFKRTGKDTVTYTAHQFVDRDYKISDEILDSTYCLEDLVNILTYDELYELHYGKSANEGKDVKEAPATKEAPASKVAGDACPAGGTFGKDINVHQYCNKCENYDACTVEAERIEEAGKTKDAPKEAPKAKEEAPAPEASKEAPVEAVRTRRRGYNIKEG
jgi:hypothetical protein